VAHALDAYTAEWERLRQRRGRRDAVARRQHEGLQRFLSLGFPTTRDEEWRFTSVAPIAEHAFTLPKTPRDDGGAPARSVAEGVDRFRLPGATAAELVFVNGQYMPALSRTGVLPEGSRVEKLSSALAGGEGELPPYLAEIARLDTHAFVALNTAFIDEGAYIQLPAGTMLEQPIHLLFVADPLSRSLLMTHPRVLVVLGANSEASLVETYTGPPDGRYFTNVVTEIVLDENAVLNHYKLQYESPEAYHVGSLHVRARRSAACTAHSVSAGGRLVRNDVVAVLDGEGIECTLNGLYLADGQRLVDNHTTIDHAQPHCGSREIYKGILADRARGVFNGKIIVRPDAQKTDARQTNRALLLSEDAQINTKPQLEIFANDVKCTHGAAVGQLDEEALFYLRSRGLGEAEARQLLIRAFAADVLNRMPLQMVRSSVEDRLLRQLARVLPAAA
jgi:Fe-S cluster assembly protein SufD